MIARATVRIAAIFVVAALTTGSVLYYMQAADESKKGSLTVHFTCDTAGRLEPCGCFTGQHGGLTRLRTWLERREGSKSALKLDVGGAIAGGNDYDIIQYRYLARAYATMGFTALNMGGREASIPAEILVSLAAVSPLPLISASLVDSKRENLLEPYRIVEAGGSRIGILGLVSPDSVAKPGAGVTILGLGEAIDRHLPAVAAKCDIVILLAFASEAEMRRIAKDYYEFSLILGGDVAGPTQEILRENDSMILFTTNQARTVGTLTGKISEGSRKRLTDPAYEILLLDESIPQDDTLLSLVREYRTEIRGSALAIDDPHAEDPNSVPGVSPSAKFVGSTSCQTCHPQSHEIWQESGHAHAFKTLVEKNSAADPHCIKCHTVGFGQPSGYRRTMGSGSLVDVGCESCHGPASEHLDKHLHGKPSAFKFRPLGPGDCKSCHYGEFSRPFDWDTFWPAIRHGKEGAK